MTRVFALLAAGAACAVGLEASAGTPLWRVGLRPFAHGGSVNALVASPDGTRVFTSAADGTLRAWTAAGESVWQHRAPDQIRDLAVLPNGALVQVRGDRLVFVDARTGLPTRQVEHRGARAPLATSADATRLAFRLIYANAVAVTGPRGAELWRAVMPAPGHVAAIALSPDGARLAVAAGKAVHVYEAGGARLHTLAHEAPVTDVVFVDAERVATAWNRRALAIWDARTGAREREVPLPSEVRTLAGHVSKKLVVAARFRGLTVWDGARTLEVESPTPRALAFSPDGARLWIATEEQSVRGFDTTTWRALDARAWPFSIPSTLALDDARGEALVGTYGGHVLRYALKDGAAIEPSARLSKAGGWRPGIRALAALGGDVAVCTTDGPAMRLSLEGRGASPLAGELTCRDLQRVGRDGEALATLGEEGGALHVIAARSRPAEKRADTLAHTRALGVDPTGRFVAVSGRGARFGMSDGALALFELRSGRRLAAHKHEGESVRALAFAPDGRTLHAAIGDDGLRTYALPSGKLLRKRKHRCERLDRLAMHPRGHLLAGSSWHGRICYFDPHTGHELEGFDATPSGLRALAFTRDGGALVTLARDGSLASWRTPTQRPPERLRDEPPSPATATPAKSVRNRDGAVVWSTSFDRVGSLSGVLAWRAVCEVGYCRLTRETPTFRETAYVKASDVEDAPDSASAKGDEASTSTSTSTAAPSPHVAQHARTGGERCARDGVCAVTLSAGAAIPHGLDESARITAKRPLSFARPMRACSIGPILKLTPIGPVPGWLSPAAFSYRAAWNPLMLPARHVRLDDAHAGAARSGASSAHPPRCDTSREGWRKRTLRVHRGPPRMGIFVLRPADAMRVDRARRNAKRAFALARRLAVRRWVYADRDCDDSVRMILLPLGAHDLAAPLIGDGLPPARVDLRYRTLRAKYWDELVLIHARMVHAYEPRVCARALRRLSAALRIARARNLRVRHFGY